MKYFAAIVAAVLLSGAAFFYHQRNPAFGAAPEFACGSPENRLIFYVAKQEINKNNQKWKDNKYVQQVLDENGSLNLDKVKHLIVTERGIMTSEEFDTAILNLKARGYFTTKAAQKAITYFQANKDCGVPVSTPPVDTGATTTPS